jgi:CelD/BcsL family acetyltransferase involved in cellulose biosynthesis
MMRVTVVQPGELGAVEAELWWKFQHATPESLNPFLSLTYVQTVGRFRDNARVAIVEDGGDVVAFFPFELSTRYLGMPIGFPLNNLQGFIGCGSSLAAKRVIKKAHLRGWRFDAVAVEQRAFAPFHYAGTTEACPVINLDKGDLSHISTRKKARRALEKEFGAVSLEWRSTELALVDQMIEWKSTKYYGTSVMFRNPTVPSIVKELAVSDSEDCRGVVSVLRAGERTIAVHLALLGPRSLVGWFMAYDPELSRFAPGQMLWHPLATAAEERGISQIDLGPGQEPYKSELANDSYLVAGGAVWVSGAEAAGRQVYRRLVYPRLRAWAEARAELRKKLLERRHVGGRRLGDARAQRVHPVVPVVEVALEGEVVLLEQRHHVRHVRRVVGVAAVDTPLGEAHRLVVRLGEGHHAVQAREVGVPLAAA